MQDTFVLCGRVLGVREDMLGEFPYRFFQRFRFPGDSPLSCLFVLLVKGIGMIDKGPGRLIVQGGV